MLYLAKYMVTIKFDCFVLKARGFPLSALLCISLYSSLISCFKVCWSIYIYSTQYLYLLICILTLLNTDFGNFLYVEAGPKLEPQRARLLSLAVGPERRPVCLLFYYQLRGEGQDSLRVLLRDDEQEETLLWALKGDQGPMWREGRTILPQSPKEYQVRWMILEIIQLVEVCYIFIHFLWNRPIICWRTIIWL